MDWIERYVREVGRRLPKRGRKDVETELRSLLQDMTEDRSGAKLEQTDEEIVHDVLREMGSPSSVAASYQPRANYLIGPRIWPIFKIVMTVVAVVLAVVTAAGVLVTVDMSQPFMMELLRMLFEAIPGYFDAVVGAFAAIVLILALVERVVPADELDIETDEDWDPTTLPPLSAGKGVDRFGALVSIVFNIVVLAVLNFYPHYIGLIHSSGGQTMAVPMLSESYYANVLPWLNFSLLAALVFNFYQLYVGRKTLAVRWLGVVSDLLSAVVIYFTIVHAPMFGVNEALIAAQGWEISSELMSGANGLVNLLNTLMRFVLPIVFIITVISAGVKAMKLLWEGLGGSKTPIIEIEKGR